MLEYKGIVLCLLLHYIRWESFLEVFPEPRSIRVKNAELAHEENCCLFLLFEDDRSGSFESVLYAGEHYDSNLLVISSQIGCPVSCQHCSVPDFSRNLPLEAMFFEVHALMHHGIRAMDSQKKNKLTFSRTGDPLLNPHVVDLIHYFHEQVLNPINAVQVTSIFPDTKMARRNFDALVSLAAEVSQLRSQLQKLFLYISIHTTDLSVRRSLVRSGISLASFEEIGEFIKEWYHKTGNHVTLTFARSPQYPLSPDILRKYFSPEFCRIRLSGLRVTEENVGALDPTTFQEDEALLSQLRYEGYVAYLAYPSPLEQKYATSPGEIVRRFSEEGMVSRPNV